MYRLKKDLLNFEAGIVGKECGDGIFTFFSGNNRLTLTEGVILDESDFFLPIDFEDGTFIEHKDSDELYRVITQDERGIRALNLHSGLFTLIPSDANDNYDIVTSVITHSKAKDLFDSLALKLLNNEY